MGTENSFNCKLHSLIYHKLYNWEIKHQKCKFQTTHSILRKKYEAKLFNNRIVVRELPRLFEI